MAIRILAIGKKHETWVAEGIERYQKRLKRPFDVEWVLLPHSLLDGHKARQEESGRLLQYIKDIDYVVLLDERGKSLSSPLFAEVMSDVFNQSKKITIVIGGAYGVNEALHHRAELVLALSSMVFPHQLVRLILIEQLYRAQEITAGGPYHHE